MISEVPWQPLARNFSGVLGDQKISNRTPAIDVSVSGEQKMNEEDDEEDKQFPEGILVVARQC